MDKPRYTLYCLINIFKKVMHLLFWLLFILKNLSKTEVFTIYNADWILSSSNIYCINIRYASTFNIKIDITLKISIII